MGKCKKCGSFAINHHCHGRDGSEPDLCDVCFWRNKSEQMQPQKSTRGGARPNSGRKATGKTVLQTTITLYPALMERMDALRGPISRSSWIAAKIKSTRKIK